MTTAAVSRRSKDRHSSFFPFPLALLLAESLAGALAPPCIVAGPVAVSESSSRARHRARRRRRVLLGQPALESVPWRPFSADAGDPAAAHRRAPPPAVASAAAAPPDPLRAVGSESNDPDPIQARVKPDHTGQPLAFLQKRPSVLQKSTRSPYLFKRNSKSAQNFSHKPLISSEI